MYTHHGSNQILALFFFTAVKKPSVVRKMSDTVAPENGTAKFDVKVAGQPIPEIKW